MNKQMILRMPSYYREFKCTADKCSDSCCVGWEIDIDSKTYDFYKSVDRDFGRRLSENIAEVSVPHFILGKDERCPFLNEKNLCEIFINLGEDRLCNICTEHPRFFEWYDGIKEGGTGLCCEASARLIITHREVFSYYDTVTEYEECNDYDEEFYDYLFKMRDMIISHLQNDEIPLMKRFNNILNFAYNMQCEYDNFSLDFLSIEQADFSDEKSDLQGILREFSSLEMLGKKNLFESAYENLKEERLPEILTDENARKAFENIAVYFVWRHFLKSVYEDEFYSKIAFSVLSTLLIAVLYAAENQVFSTDELIVKSVYYSKEIEYSEQNLCKIFDNFYENDAFSISKISSLLKFFSNF